MGCVQYRLCPARSPAWTLDLHYSCPDHQPGLQLSSLAAWASWINPGWIWDLYSLPTVLSLLQVPPQPLSIISLHLGLSLYRITVTTPALLTSCGSVPWPGLRCRCPWPLACSPSWSSLAYHWAITAAIIYDLLHFLWVFPTAMGLDSEDISIYKEQSVKLYLL